MKRNVGGQEISDFRLEKKGVIQVSGGMCNSLELQKVLLCLGAEILPLCAVRDGAVLFCHQLRNG